MQSEILPELSMADYLAHPAVSSSRLKVLLSSPKDFQAYLAAKREDTPATSLGTAIHMIALEPEKFHTTYAIQIEDWGPKNQGEGYKKWKEFKAKNAGKICLDYEDSCLIRRVVTELTSNRAWNAITAAGRPEVSAFSEYKGIHLKARVDWLTDDGMIWDIKTTSKGLSDRDLERLIFQSGYHFQAAFHSLVFKAHTPITGFGWIFISTGTPAVHVVTRRASAKVLEAGDYDVTYALDLLQKCKESDSWWGQSDDEIKEINLPEFAQNYYQTTEETV